MISVSEEPRKKINRIVVLGGGSAGFLAAFGIKKQMPEIEVVVVRSTKMGVIGVGEGTIWSVVNFLHHFIGIPAEDFHKKINPSIKLGIHYLWGPRPFFNYTFAPQLTAPLKGSEIPRGYFCDEDFDYADMASVLMTHDKVCIRKPNGLPHLPGSFAYHLENRLFVGYLEELASEYEIETIDDLVCGVEDDEDGINTLILESGQKVSADFFIDCSGFRAELIGKALNEEFKSFQDVLYCDRAIFGGWERTPDDPYHPYTTAETMNSGWSWQIEHDHVVNRGYVYCSQFISDDEADAEFRKRNPNIEHTKSVKFNAGVRKRTWVKNVIAFGNAAGFVEPLEATAIGMICDGVVNFVRAIKSTGGYLAPAARDAYNRLQETNWELIRDFLAVHYKFNKRLDTPFWNACINDTNLGGAQKYIDLYHEVGPDFSLLTTEMKRDFFGAEGYLSMLVGQQLPYRRQLDLSFEEKHRWKLYRNNLKESIYEAMDMKEYLEFVRGSGLPEFSESKRLPAEAEGVGELQWH